MVTIRRASIKDFDALKRLKLLSKEEELKHSKTLKSVKKNKEKYFEYLKKDLKDKTRAMFVAVDNDKIVGMILGKAYKTLSISKYKKKSYLSNLYVDVKYRKKGIARKLMNKVMDWLKDQGVKHTTLEVYVNNKGAQNLFYDIGFEDYTLKLTKNI